MMDVPSIKTDKDETAQHRILNAALDEFGCKGFYGARTQSIAEAAGVNKALLHYYFRSKEKLYLKVIQTSLKQLWTELFREWISDRPLMERIERVVDIYMDTVSNNPGIVKIVLREVVDGGRRFKMSFDAADGEPLQINGLNPVDILNKLGDEIGVAPEEGMHAFINLIGMCVVSFISPVLLEAVGNKDLSDLESYLNDRRKAIKHAASAYVKVYLSPESGGNNSE